MTQMKKTDGQTKVYQENQNHTWFSYTEYFLYTKETKR